MHLLLVTVMNLYLGPGRVGLGEQYRIRGQLLLALKETTGRGSRPSTESTIVLQRAVTAGQLPRVRAVWRKPTLPGLCRDVSDV